MIDLYYWTTPNGHKITMYLEEAGLEYKVKPVNIGKGEQFDAAFLAISPNNKMPAIVDHAPADGGKAIPVFESGAILLYLAGKTGTLMPKDLRGQVECLEWVMWQMAGLGPMLGQNHHFSTYAPEKIPYAIDRYVKETSRLYAVLNKRLAGRDFILGKHYSIADIACYPWIIPDRQGQDMGEFPNLRRWHAAIKARPATTRAYAVANQVNPNRNAIRTEEEKKILFGQDKSVVK
ncbi:MAG TPA: glutathione S-transferase C-terminal domain-containing protein [Usitatibacter sp.]|jgi:GST-like protein|nr:glutathione S-transferase C-terminal domain-containing protein [Usitatibacter sp.]